MRILSIKTTDGPSLYRVRLVSPPPLSFRVYVKAVLLGLGSTFSSVFPFSSHSLPHIYESVFFSAR